MLKGQVENKEKHAFIVIILFSLLTFSNIPQMIL